MGRLLAIAAVVAAVGITIVAVNGPGPGKPADHDAASPAHESARVSSAPKPRAAKPGAVVRMKDLRFRPEAVSIDKGQSVRFVNDDDVAHTVVEDVGARSGVTAVLSSKRILPGQSFTFVPPASGVIPFVCTLHPTVMVGQILVDAPAT